MAEDRAYTWDFFLAHAGPDGPIAKDLFDLLAPSCRVFLDNQCLLLGDDWDLALRDAQRASRITVVLVSGRTEKAYYQREEIAAAIAMAREDKEQHRVVPVYLDDPPFDHEAVPYGLRLKHSVSLNQEGGLQGIAQRLQDLFARVTGTAFAPVARLASPATTTYYSDLLRALDRDFPLPLVEFGLTLAAPDGRRLAAADLIVEAKRAKRIVIRASAGAGKSMVAGRLARVVPDTGFLPVVLNLKNWQKDRHSVELLKPDVDVQRRLSLLFEVSIVDLPLARYEELAREQPALIIVDGLNEVAGEETVRKVVEVLDQHVRETAPRTAVLVADRAGSRAVFEHKWEFVTLNPLALAEVNERIDDAFGHASFAALNQREQTLLQRPFFLKRALDSPSPHLGSAAKALESFFSDQLNIRDAVLDNLAEAAFGIYRDQQSSSFKPDTFRTKVGEPVWHQLTDASVIKEIATGLAQFDHQLQHDYLASRHVATGRWDTEAFDAITFQTNSYEPLSLVLEQLIDELKGEEFLKRVHDWNWGGAVFCIAESARSHERHHTPEVEVAMLAVACEKLFDPMRRSRAHLLEQLAVFPPGTVDRYTGATSLNDIFAIVNEAPSARAWFTQWRTLFTRHGPPPLREDEIACIVDPDPITGWTAANVAKRFSVADPDLRQLRAYYHARKGTASLDATIRWRIVHALGSFPTTENVDLLFAALDNDGFHWTRYGAARSLVEIAARTTDTAMRARVINGLNDRLPALSPKLVGQIGRAADYEGAPATWNDDLEPLLRTAVAAQATEPGREHWTRLVQYLEKACEQTPVLSSVPEKH
jgi:hypothetical protein